jgi:biotin-dependent carboxylase-like uncharacterized protein
MQAATVVEPGALTLLEDAGRVGYGHLGVPRAGAFDPMSWRLANRLVGNPQDCAALETLGGGLSLHAHTHLTIAVTGASGSIFVDGRGFETGTVIHVQPEARVTLGQPRSGIRYYLAVRGGLLAEPTLGSRSYDTLGHMGPPPLRAADVLSIGPPRDAAPIVDHAPTGSGIDAVFTVLPGPDATEWALRQLQAREWDLDPQSNRIGVRLSGAPIEHSSGSTASRPLVLGAMQLPPNGLPIVLGPDHPTTGGYPVIAVVTAHSMCHIAQWAGGPRRFRLA